MKVRFILLSVLLLAITVQSCGKSVDYVSIATSLEDSLNAGEADAAASLWADDGYFEMNQDPGNPSSPRIICRGKDEIRECFQTIVGRGIQFRFSDFREIRSFLCFIGETSLNGVDWSSGEVHMRFEGEKITFRGTGCPSE